MASTTTFNGIKSTSTIDTFKNDILDIIYPVGCFYCTGSNNTNPSTILGRGTWTSTAITSAKTIKNGSYTLTDKTGTLENTAGTISGTAVDGVVSGTCALTSGAVTLNVGISGTAPSVNATTTIYVWKRTA